MPGSCGRGLVNARLLGSKVSGLSHCRVAAFNASDLLRLTNFFITFSHCAWRHVISWSLATKKRSKESAFNHTTLSVHSVQFLFIGAPNARCSPEPPMFETLLLANPDIDTLRHQCPRASSVCLRTRTALSFFRRATRPPSAKKPPTLTSHRRLVHRRLITYCCGQSSTSRHKHLQSRAMPAAP